MAAFSRAVIAISLERSRAPKSGIQRHLAKAKRNPGPGLGWGSAGPWEEAPKTEPG